nr:hypothetical protein [Tanacetum cinerariifolium]
MGPTVATGQKTTLSYAFNVGMLHDPPTGTWKMDTRKCVLLDDEVKPLEMIDYMGDHYSEDEVDHIDNEIESFVALKPSGVGYGTNSLLEQ